jgi:hypothetical protein
LEAVYAKKAETGRECGKEKMLFVLGQVYDHELRSARKRPSRASWTDPGRRRSRLWESGSISSRSFGDFTAILEPERVVASGFEARSYR